MRDQHRPKQELIDEVVALRKQVADLKEAAVARRRIEDAVRASEEHYRSLFEHAPTGICGIGPEGDILHANPALAELLGYRSKSELVEAGRVVGVFASAEEQQCILGQLRISGAIRDCPARWRRKDGETVAVGLTGRAVRDHSGATQYFALFVEAAATQLNGLADGAEPRELGGRQVTRSASGDGIDLE